MKFVIVHCGDMEDAAGYWQNDSLFAMNSEDGMYPFDLPVNHLAGKCRTTQKAQEGYIYRLEVEMLGLK